MKKAKRLLALVCGVLIAACAFAGCGGKTDAGGNTSAEDDLSYVKNKGSLIVGITSFEPMDYQKEEGDEWYGFDADMAKAFAKSLGVDVKFQLIKWESKLNELNDKNIDVVWNGMTLTDEVTSAMECTKPYCGNAQVIVVKSADKDKYTDKNSIKGKSVAVEKGSAGKTAAEEAGATCVELQDQATALMDVKGGNSDAAVIDSLMAGAMIGEGTSYPDLVATANLTEEFYGVGFRKGSNLAAELDKFFDAAYADGSMLECAKTYGVQLAIVER